MEKDSAKKMLDMAEIVNILQDTANGMGGDDFNKLDDRIRKL